MWCLPCGVCRVVSGAVQYQTQGEYDRLQGMKVRPHRHLPSQGLIVATSGGLGLVSSAIIHICHVAHIFCLSTATITHAGGHHFSRNALWVGIAGCYGEDSGSPCCFMHIFSIQFSDLPLSNNAVMERFVSCSNNRYRMSIDIACIRSSVLYGTKCA